MVKNYWGLWEGVASTSDEGKAVRTLTQILVDREGSAFISSLELGDAELCIGILYHVSLSSICRIRFPLPRLRWLFY